MPWPYSGSDEELKALAQLVECYERCVTIPYFTTVRPAGNLDRCQMISVTNGVGFTMADPTLPREGVAMLLDIWNNSGGVMGTITWGSSYELVRAFENPTAGNHVIIAFMRMSDGKGREIYRTAATTPAPNTADYLVRTADAGLTAERVVTDTATITWDFATAGQAKANNVVAASHVLATNVGLGAQHTMSGAANRQVLIASSATAANFRALVAADIPILDHTTDLSNIGTNTHAQIDTHIAAANPHSGSAPLASPALTGNPTAPTAAGGDNDTSIATTAFVQGELSGYALLASPAFSGNPTAPTQAAGNNSTRLATTAFVATSFAPLASPTFTGTVTAATGNFSGVLTGLTGIVSGNSTPSSKNTLGLTVNQGSSDDECITVQSSDVAHGMTTRADTDTFGLIAKVNAAGGGMLLQGLSDASSSGGLWLQADCGATDGTKSTVAVSSIVINAAKKSGTGVTSIGANQNILTVQDNLTTRFILDADGDSHQDVGTAWTNFDVFDDVETLNLLTAHVTRPDDPLKNGFTAWLEKDRSMLERMQLVSFNDDGHHFVNMSRLTMLLVGAVRQLGARLDRMDQMETRLAALEAA